MAAVFEKSLQKEWDKAKQDIQNVIKDLKAWAQEADVTFEVDAGVVKLTIEVKLEKPS